MHNVEQSSPKPPALARQLQKLPELELQPHQEKLPSLQLSGSPPLNNCPTFIQEHLALNDGSSTVIIAETCLYRPTIPQLFPPLPEPNFPPLPPESSHPLNPIPDLPPNSHTPGTSVPVPPERGPLQPPLPQPTAPQTDAPLPTAPLPTAPQPTAPQPNPQQPTTKPAAPQQPAPQQPEAAKKVPVGEREQAALDKEREQYDQLRAEEIYARMEAEKALHEARIQALWQDLQTEIQRIIRETMLHRQKVMDEINKNWHKILIG